MGSFALHFFNIGCVCVNPTRFVLLALAATSGDTLSYSLVNPAAAPLLQLSTAGVLTLINGDVSGFYDTVTVDVRATDPFGLSDTATISIVVIPLGAARFAGFSSTLMPTEYPTAGGAVIEMLGENLVLGANISAIYRSVAMRALNMTYTAQVLACGRVGARFVGSFSLAVFPSWRGSACFDEPRCPISALLLFCFGMRRPPHLQGCVVVSSERMTCMTAPGVGMALEWTMLLNGGAMQVTSSTRLYIGYDAPAVATATVVGKAATAMRTLGGDTIMINGQNFGPNCNFTTAFLGALPLSLVSCNVTTILATVPAGAGVAGALALTVGDQVAAIAAPASGSFAYAAPTIASLTSDGLLPTLGYSGGVGKVSIVGSNFGPATSELVVTFVSGMSSFSVLSCVCLR